MLDFLFKFFIFLIIKMETSKTPEIPKTQIIELREQNKRTIKSENAGDYRVLLDRPVKLEEGDALSLFNATIDTASASGGLIDLKPDAIGGSTTTISADVGYYMRNIPSSAEGPFNTGAKVDSKAFSPSTGNINTDTDGELYVACHVHEVADTATTMTVSGFRCELDPDFMADSKQASILDAGIFIVPVGQTAYKRVGTITLMRNIKNSAIQFLLQQIDSDLVLQVDNDLYKKVDDYAKAHGLVNPFTEFPSFPFTCKLNHFEYANANIGGIQNVTGRPDPLPNGPVNDGLNFLIKETNSTGKQRTLITNTVSLVLPSGKYTAAELARRIGVSFTGTENGGAITQLRNTANDADVTGGLVNNAILTNVRQLMAEADGKSVGSAVKFVRAKDGLKEFNFTTTRDVSNQNYIVGSSQFSLLYAEDMSKMEIDMMHTPLLDLTPNKGGAPQIRGYKNASNTAFYVNSYSGIFIASWSPADVWNNQFKFNNNLCVGYGKPTKVNIASVGDVIVPIFNSSGHKDNSLIEGVNITGSDIGVDTTILKQATVSGGGVVTSAFDIPLSFPAFPDYLGANTADNVSIFGDDIINDAQYGSQDLAYYQVEVGMGIPSEIEGKDEYNNKIQAIVSKYYSAGSYTSSFGEGALKYVHKGSPIELSQFSVRILTPENRIATDISDDNTIFLRIDKTK